MSTESAAPHPLLVMAALLVVQILFGLNYVFSKVVIQAFPPLVWASLRIIIAATIMIVVALLARRPRPHWDRRFFGPLVIFALLGTIINQASFLMGLRYTTPTNSSILNTLIPIFTLLIVTIRGQEPVTFYRVIGFFCALAGVLALRNIENFTFSDKTLVGDMLTVVNCLSYAIFLSFSKTFLQKYDRFWTTAWLFIYGSVGIGMLAVPDWTTFHWPEMTKMLWACATYAIVGGTLLTYFLNNWALVHSKSSHVALFIYVQPVVASLFAWFWFDDPITPREVFSSLLIFCGVYLAINQDPFNFGHRVEH
jgi:drug/metabolite transporter (DMT)-like permease